MKPLRNTEATRVIDAFRKAGVTATAIANSLDVTVATISKWKHEYGDYRHGKIPAKHRAKLRELAELHGVKIKAGDL